MSYYLGLSWVSFVLFVITCYLLKFRSGHSCGHSGLVTAFGFPVRLYMPLLFIFSLSSKFPEFGSLYFNILVSEPGEGNPGRSFVFPVVVVMAATTGSVKERERERKARGVKNTKETGSARRIGGGFRI